MVPELGTGAPTGALYGLVSMLLKIVTDLKPDYIAACFDLPKPTIRHEAYADYKGTRVKTDDALALQLNESRKVFEAFSIPMYEREGYEADDLLGTIAHELREEGVDVIIASGDMDTLQLVDDERVRVYTLKKGINDTILYDEKSVVARFGFIPALIPDWKGLRGDPSDNIKGVPGIGEKTMNSSLERQLRTYTQLKETFFLKKGESSNDHSQARRRSRFSKSLATIRLDAPIAFVLPEHLHGQLRCRRYNNVMNDSVHCGACTKILTNASSDVEGEDVSNPHTSTGSRGGRSDIAAEQK